MRCFSQQQWWEKYCLMIFVYFHTVIHTHICTCMTLEYNEWCYKFPSTILTITLWCKRFVCCFCNVHCQHSQQRNKNHFVTYSHILLSCWISKTSDISWRWLDLTFIWHVSAHSNLTKQLQSSDILRFCCTNRLLQPIWVWHLIL